jgi:hypothetical protein
MKGEAVLEGGESHTLGKTGAWPDMEEASVWSVGREGFRKPRNELRILINDCPWVLV